MAKEIAVHLSIYLKAQEGETEEQARKRAEKFINKKVSDFQIYDIELREI